MSFLQSPTMSVTELTRYLRELLESDHTLQDLWVQGEVSNFSRPGSGHFYFTLKDREAALRCVMWRSAAQRQVFIPKDGDHIEIHGAISIYEAGGVYQLYVDVMRPLGEGALYQEFLRLKAQLEAEGLFDLERKREIPLLPWRIGIVTSPTGAALRDMLNTIRRRFPLAEVILAPTQVQGLEAPVGVVAAIQALNQRVHPDVILVARGGGSLEDLWAFNDERVARAIASSSTPVISGVGHETDFTIADFVADLRAPTPTAAAELATPNQADLREAVLELRQRLARSVQNTLNTQRWTLETMQNRLNLNSPRTRLASYRQYLDELVHRSGLSAAHRLQMQRARLRSLEQRLAVLSPAAVLERGFAILTRKDGQLVSRVQQVSSGDELDVQVRDGQFGVTVNRGP